MEINVSKCRETISECLGKEALQVVGQSHLNFLMMRGCSLADRVDMRRVDAGMWRCNETRSDVEW